MIKRTGMGRGEVLRIVAPEGYVCQVWRSTVEEEPAPLVLPAPAYGRRYIRSSNDNLGRVMGWLVQHTTPPRRASWLRRLFQWN